MKIYLTRHGETEWNAMYKVCGRVNVPLSERGVHQANQLAKRLVGCGIQQIIASPMQRALHTARIIADTIHAPCRTDERLIEQSYGIYENEDRRNPDFLRNKRQFAFRYPEGESMMQVAYRTYDLLEELRNEPFESVLLVCHGGVCRVLRTYFQDMTNDEFFLYAIDNCELEVFELPPREQRHSM